MSSDARPDIQTFNATFTVVYEPVCRCGHFQFDHRSRVGACELCRLELNSDNECKRYRFMTYAEWDWEENWASWVEGGSC